MWAGAAGAAGWTGRLACPDSRLAYSDRRLTHLDGRLAYPNCRLTHPDRRITHPDRWLTHLVGSLALPAPRSPDCDYGRQHRVKAGKRALTRHCRPCSGFGSGCGRVWVLVGAGTRVGSPAERRAKRGGEGSGAGGGASRSRERGRGAKPQRRGSGGEAPERGAKPQRKRGPGGEAPGGRGEAAPRQGPGAKPPGRGSRGRSPPGGGLGVRPPEDTDETEEKAEAPKGRRPSRRWRCRELNPGPLAYQQGFSVRSPLRLCLAPSVTRTSRGDEPSHCLLHDSSPWPGLPLSLLADAGTRAGGEPGPTETHSLRRRGRTRADWSRRLFGCDDA